MPSPRWSFSLFPGRAPRFCGAVGRRKRQPFPPPKRAWRGTCTSSGSMDGCRFGWAPKSAAFSRGGRLKMARSMSEAALWPFCCARCTRNRPLGRPFPVRIINGFHPPKVPDRADLLAIFLKGRHRRPRDVDPMHFGKSPFPRRQAQLKAAQTISARSPKGSRADRSRLAAGCDAGLFCRSNRLPEAALLVDPRHV